MAHYHGYQRTDGSVQQRILPLLTPIWEDHELNDISFLKADPFSWQSGSLYKAAYQHLESDVFGKTLTSETISGITIQYYLANDGHKICPASEESNVASLFNTTGVAWYYILDTVNQRFKLPRSKFGFVGLRDGVGNCVRESLPNVTGAIANVANGGNSSGNATGAFKVTGVVNNNKAPSSAYGFISTYSFDASDSSSTYQDNAPVQQRATQMYLYFYVGEFTQSAMANTAGINAETLNGKLDLDVGNATSVTKHNVNTWSCPSGRYIDLILLASGSTYTAPANGCFHISKVAGSTYYYTNIVRLSPNGEDIQGDFTDAYATSPCESTMNVKEGDVVRVDYNATGQLKSFRFIYAEGESNV